MKALSPSELWYIDHDHELLFNDRARNQPSSLPIQQTELHKHDSQKIQDRPRASAYRLQELDGFISASFGRPGCIG